MLLESSRQLHLGHLDAIQTVRLLALFAIEVGMEVVVVVIVMAMAQLVAGAVTSSLDGMHQVMLAEERKSAEHVRLVYSLDAALQLGQRQWLDRRGQSLNHNNTIAGGLYAVLFEQVYESGFVHNITILSENYLSAQSPRSRLR